MRLVYTVIVFICLLGSCCYCQDPPPFFDLPPPPPLPVEHPPLETTEITTSAFDIDVGKSADVQIESNETLVEQNDTSLINTSAVIENAADTTSSEASVDQIVTVSSVTDNPSNDSVFVDVNVMFTVLSSNDTRNETVSDTLVSLNTSGNISDNMSYVDKNLTENINSSVILKVSNESMLTNESQLLALPEIVVPSTQQLTPEIQQDTSNMTAVTSVSTDNETVSQNGKLVSDLSDLQNETDAAPSVQIEAVIKDSTFDEQPLQPQIFLPPPPIPDSSLVSFEEKPGETTIEITGKMLQDMANIMDFKTTNETIPTTTPFSITTDLLKLDINSNNTNVTAYDITTSIYNISEAQPMYSEKPTGSAFVPDHPPAFALDHPPAFAPEQQPAFAPDQQPASSTDQQPAFVPDQQPAFAPDQQPAVAPDQQQAFAPDQEPASSTDQQPAFVPDHQPVFAPDKQPAVAPDQQQAFAPDKQPALSTDQQPAFAPDQIPSLPTDQQPAFAPDQQPALSTDQQSAFVPDQQSEFASDHQTAFAPDQQPAIARDKQPAFAPDQQPTFAPDQQPALSTVQQAAFAPDQQPALSTDHQPAFVPDQQPAFAPDRQPALAPEHPPAFAPDHPPPITFGIPESFIPERFDQGPVYAQVTEAQRIQGPTTEAPPPPIFIQSAKQTKVKEKIMQKVKVNPPLTINYEDPRFMNTAELAAYALQMSKEKKLDLQTFMRHIPETTTHQPITTPTTTTTTTSTTTTSPTTATSTTYQPIIQTQHHVQNRIMPNFLRKLYESQLSQISTTPITTTYKPTLPTKGESKFFNFNNLLALYGINLSTTTLSPPTTQQNIPHRAKPISHKFYDAKYLLSHLGIGLTTLSPVVYKSRETTVPTVKTSVQHINKPEFNPPTVGQIPAVFPHEQMLNKPKRPSNVHTVISNKAAPPPGLFPHERINIDIKDQTSSQSVSGITQLKQGLYGSSIRSSLVDEKSREKTVPTVKKSVPHINQHGINAPTVGTIPAVFLHAQLLNKPKRPSNVHSIIANKAAPPPGSFPHERRNIDIRDQTSLSGGTRPKQGLYGSSTGSSFVKSLDTWLNSPEFKQPSLEQFGTEKQALIKNQQQGQSDTRPLHPSPHRIPLVPYNTISTSNEIPANIVPTDTTVSVSNAVYMFKPRGHLYGDKSNTGTNNAIPDTPKSLKGRFNKKWFHQEPISSNEPTSIKQPPVNQQAGKTEARGTYDLFNRIFNYNLNIPSQNIEMIRQDEQRQLQEQQRQLNEQVQRELIIQQQRQQDQIRLLEKQHLEEQKFQEEQRRMEEALRAQEIQEQQRLLEFQTIDLKLQQRIEQQRIVDVVQQKEKEKQNRLAQRRMVDLQQRQAEPGRHAQRASNLKHKIQVRHIQTNEMPLSPQTGIRETLPNSNIPFRLPAQQMQVSSIQIFQAPGFLMRHRKQTPKSTAAPVTQKPPAQTTQKPTIGEEWHAHVDWSDLHGHLGVPYKVNRQQLTTTTVATTTQIQTTPLTTQMRVQPDNSSVILLPINMESPVPPTTLPPTTTQQTLPPTANPNPPPIFDIKFQMTFMPMPKIEMNTKPSVNTPTGAAGIDKTVSPNFDKRCNGCVFVNERCLLPDPVHCNKYIECVKQNEAARAFNRECALGSFFDRKSFLCVDPKNADCPTDRCREANTKWYPIHGHCKHYWSCGLREGGSAFAQSECCPDMGGFVDGQGCIEDKNCTDSCEKPIVMDGPKAESCAPILSMTFNGSNIMDESNTKQHIGVEGVTTTLEGEGLFRGDGRLVLWRYANYMFPLVFAVRFRFLSSSTGPRYQPLLSNCDGKTAQQPSLEVSIDTLYHEVIFKVDTYKGTARIFKIMYNHKAWTEVDVLYDGERIVGAVDRRPRNMFAAGGIQTRPNPISVGSCNRSTGFKGLMDDVYIYEECVPDEMYGIFMSVLE